MPHLVHLIAVPHHDLAFARTFGLGHLRYTPYLHRRTQRSGHLWQGRFSAAPLDESYLARTVRYVERNPRRAQVVTAPEDWPCSSAAAHLRGERLYPPSEALLTWREFLAMEDAADAVAAIRQRTLRGRPLGHDAFSAHLEVLAGKPLNRGRGRPRKNIAEGDK